MNSEKKLNKLWEKIEVAGSLISDSFSLSKRDMKVAMDLFEKEDYDWAYAICYNAILQAGRAFMFSKGFRPKGSAKHVSVIEFLSEEFEKELGREVIFKINKMRKKRHLAVYEQVEIITREDVLGALEVAKKFIDKVEEKL